MARVKQIKSRLSLLDQRAAPPPAEIVEKLYSSPAWLGLMASLRKQRGNQCQRCDRKGCRMFGDHIVELKDGGAKLDPANVQILCGACHTLKTNAERAKRMRAPLT